MKDWSYVYVCKNKYMSRTFNHNESELMMAKSPNSINIGCQGDKTLSIV